MDEVAEIFAALQEVTNVMFAFLGADPQKHHLLRGTFEAAIAEAQGAELIKVKNFTPVNQSFNHFQAMREGANAMRTALSDFSDLMMRLRRIDLQAAMRADAAFRPLTDSAALRVDTARKTEELIIEITNTRNQTRLQGVPLQLGRSQAGLVSNQLRQMNLSLVPNTLSRSTPVLDRIRTFPITSDDAKTLAKQISAMVSSSAFAVRALARTAATRALAALEEFLVAFGSRFSVFIPPVPKETLESWSGSSSKGS